MSDIRQAAQQALGTLERCAFRLYDPSFVASSIDAIRAALAAPACGCGEPTATGVVHRRDGPCYMAEPAATGEIERLRTALAAAVAEERERCAKLCDEAKPQGGRMWTDEQAACFDCLTHVADAIRAAPAAPPQREPGAIHQWRTSWLTEP